MTNKNQKPRQGRVGGAEKGEEDLLRLLSHTKMSKNGCLEWVGALSKKGCWKFLFNGKNCYATRVHWELAIGKIKIGLMVRHKCGNPKCVSLDHLFLGLPERLDLRGYKYGRLSPIEPSISVRTRGGMAQTRWKCKCDCGNLVIAKTTNLRNGNTQSCGCKLKDWNKSGLHWKKHGLKSHPIYQLWKGMKYRCSSPTCDVYSGYGGRGITVCEFINESPANLLSVLGERPEGRHESGRVKWTIDRKDNDNGYWCGSCGECVRLGRPLNIRWATALTQNHNSRHVVNLTIQGETACLSEWARRFGIHTIKLKKWLRDGMLGPRMAVAI